MNVQAIEIQADDENDGDMRPYLNASPEERLRILYDEMRELGRPAPLDDRQRAFYEGRLIGEPQSFFSGLPTRGCFIESRTRRAGLWLSLNLTDCGSSR
jgi:hypothetical protein